MVRKNIFETMEKYDIQTEAKKIIKLFFARQILVPYDNLGRYELLSIEEIIKDYNILQYWKRRGALLGCNEIREKLKLSNNDLEKKNISKDKILTFLEYALNIIFLIKNRYHNELSFLLNDDQHIQLILNNIEILLEHLNYKYISIGDEEKILVVPNDISKRFASEKAQEDGKKISDLIYEYDHKSLRGNIKRKSQILFSIYHEYEKAFGSKNNSGFSKYYELIKFLVNKCHIRHDNTKEMAQFDNKTLEYIYDKLYRLMLICIIIRDGNETKQELEYFKSKIEKKEK